MCLNKYKLNLEQCNGFSVVTPKPELGPADFHIAGNGLYTMLVTTLKDSKTSKHVSILYQL